MPRIILFMFIARGKTRNAPHPFYKIDIFMFESAREFSLPDKNGEEIVVSHRCSSRVPSVSWYTVLYPAVLHSR